MINFKAVAGNLARCTSKELIGNPDLAWSDNLFGGTVLLARTLREDGDDVIVCVVTASEVLCESLKFLLEHDLGPAKEEVEEPTDPIHALIDEVRDDLLKEELGAIQRVFTWPASVLAKSAFSAKG